MDEVKSEKSPQQLEHESNKIVREGLAWAHQRLHTVPTYFEEHQMHKLAIDVLSALCLDLQKKIEAVEPPPPEDDEPKKAYIVDAPPLRPVPEKAK